MALVAPVALLGALGATAGLSRAGWVIGVAAAVVMAAALARAGERLSAASWITLTRATLAVGVGALAVDGPPVALLVTLASVALALDLVDGWLARRTETVSAL